MTTLQRLRDKANSLPQSPGVYLMKNEGGEILYVGKSKKLKSRVTTYFTGTGHTIKTSRLVALIHDFDYIVCDTEIEALSLENVLIKRYTPKYNIKLKDAKSYPYIKVSRGEYPRLYVTRDRRDRDARYYGPYTGTAGAYAALEALTKIFKIPTCKRVFPRDIGKERPCLYLQMGRCVGVCTGKVDPHSYRESIRAIESVLSGNIKATVEKLTEEMLHLAECEEFERAASVRDSIRALNALLEKQKVVADVKVSRDVFAFYASETVSILSVLTVREGALLSKGEFVLSQNEYPSADDTVSLIADYYDAQGNLPREIMLDFDLDEDDLVLLSEYLSLNSSHKIRVRVPERGEGRALCDMALENAKEAARQYMLQSEREDKTFLRFAELLGLGAPPRRIEAYDISNLANEAITASMVVLERGKFKRSDYRTFSIKTTAGQDDFGSMREVLTRRLSHIGDGSPSLGECPSVLLIDGGDGQVGVVKEVLRELSLSIPVFGMVKDDFHKTRAITDGEREISIAQELPVYTFVYKIQEEAHRRAVRSTMEQKKKALTHSSLEKIRGIGPKKAQIILHTLPFSEIKQASLDTLLKIPHISHRDAEAIFHHFHKESEKQPDTREKARPRTKSQTKKKGEIQ